MPPLKSESPVTYGQLIKYCFMMFSALVILIGAVVGYALQEGNQNSLMTSNAKGIQSLQKIVKEQLTTQNKHSTEIAVIKKTVGIE
ncbi:hypothetical protein KAR91_54355 [Candidatus Pacearchaeota archaeon]|nr:hypothetical protein [Candidatus Pacearchaeota archaeon]